MSKRDSQKSHFRRRVYERYGLTINEGEYNFLVSCIKSNKKDVVQFLMRQSNRITVHLLTYKDIQVVGVYDKIRKSLVTALPIVCKDVTQIMSYVSELEDYA